MRSLNAFTVENIAVIEFFRDVGNFIPGACIWDMTRLADKGYGPAVFDHVPVNTLACTTTMDSRPVILLHYLDATDPPNVEPGYYLAGLDSDYRPHYHNRSEVKLPEGRYRHQLMSHMRVLLATSPELQLMLEQLESYVLANRKGFADVLMSSF